MANSIVSKVSKPAKFATAYDPPNKDYIFALFVELEQATAIVDLLYTVATEKQVDGLCDGTIESSLHTVLERLGAVKAAAADWKRSPCRVLGGARAHRGAGAGP